MFSTFSKFSANNIDRINRSKNGDRGLETDLTFKENIEKAQKYIDQINKLKELRENSDHENKARKKENDNKPLGGDTNQMIFGAMVFAFLVIATMGVAAMGAGPLGVAAMGVFAAGVGGALVAKVGKKLRDKVLKPQHNFSKTNSETIDNLANQLKKDMQKEFAPDKQGSSSSPSLPFGGNKKEVKELKKEVENLTKQLIESQENHGIKDLEDKIMEKAKKVLGDDFEGLFKNTANEVANFGEFITNLKTTINLHDDKDKGDTVTKSLKELVQKCDEASNEIGGIKPNQKRLVYSALKDIFKDCEKKGEDEKNALKDAIKKDPGAATIDQSKKDEVKKLVTEKTKTVTDGMDKAKADDKKVNDRINQPKAASQQI